MSQVPLNGRAAGIICLLAGIGLTALVWHGAVTRGRYDIKAATIGPILMALGIGFLIHGAAMPPNRATPLLRIYGFGGSLIALAQLAWFGFFEKGLVEIGLGALLVVIWLLPSRFFESRNQATEPVPAAASGRRPVDPATPRPIDPS